MTTDHELLELAAKAIGEKCEQVSGSYGLYKPRPGIMQPYVKWDPLTDDGDALRLAVKLKLPLDFSNSYYFNKGPLTKCGQGWNSKESLFEPFIVMHDKDPYAATRRAIVRAAAEIGRNMK